MSNQNNTAVSMPQNEFARLLVSDDWIFTSDGEIDLVHGKEDKDEGDTAVPTSAGLLDIVATHEHAGIKIEFAVGFYFVADNKDSADMSFGRVYPLDEPTVTKNGAPLTVVVGDEAMSAGAYLSTLVFSEDDSFVDDLFDVRGVIEQAIERCR